MPRGPRSASPSGLAGPGRLVNKKPPEASAGASGRSCTKVANAALISPLLPALSARIRRPVAAAAPSNSRNVVSVTGAWGLTRTAICTAPPIRAARRLPTRPHRPRSAVLRVRRALLPRRGPRTAGNHHRTAPNPRPPARPRRRSDVARHTSHPRTTHRPNPLRARVVIGCASS